MTMPLAPEKLATMKASTERAVAGLAHGHMPIPVVPIMRGLAEDVLALIVEVERLQRAVEGRDEALRITSIKLVGVDDLRAQVERLRSLLRELEWSGSYACGDAPACGESECPACHARQGTLHVPDCRLAALLR